MTEGTTPTEKAPSTEKLEVGAVEPVSVETLFQEALQTIEAREDLTDKDRKHLEKSVRRLEADFNMDRLAVKVDTSKELDEARRLIEEQLEDIIEYGKFPGKNADDLSETLNSAVRKEEAEDRINELGVAGLEGFEDVETVEDLAELSLTQLLSLEAKHEGILLYAFTDFVGRKEKIDVANFEEFYKAPEAGVKLQVDFRGNPEAEAELGMGDILPPSIRRVTVYEDGDKKRVRTSEVRIGLKDQGKEGSGFFDKQGYIPVFTDDVILVGGEKSKKKDSGINMDFEKKFRKEDGTLDFDKYSKSDEYKEAAKFFESLPRGAQQGKQMTPEELDAFMEDIDTSGNGEAVVTAVDRELRKGALGARGAHCWDWVHKVYKRAGMTFRRVYQDLNYSGKDCGSHHAGPDLIDRLEPGDWLYINNKNGVNVPQNKGNHSVIFMGWQNKKDGIMKAASCPGAGQLGRAHTVDINQSPIVHISKPVAAGGNRAARRRERNS